MEPLASAEPAPTKAELIQLLSKPITKVITEEMNDEADIDRIWLLRKYHKNYLYYRDLAYFTPALYQGLIDATGIDGTAFPDVYGQAGGIYDYTQNHFRGYCRKEIAVLGTRLPNVVAVPDDPSDEDDISAARAANDAALYIRQQCEMQVQMLWLVFKLFNFGTTFWSIEWVVDGQKYGYKEVQQLSTETVDLPQDEPADGAMPNSPAPVQVPQQLPPKMIPKGALEITLVDGTEVSVPLDVDAQAGTEGCYWINRERERHKSYFLFKYNGENDTVNLRELLKDNSTSENSFDNQTASQQYGESIRSAMSSPIGVVRPKRDNRWTERWEDWTPQMYEMVDDAHIRQTLKTNFPKGARFTFAKGRLVDIEHRDIHRHWVACQPEPTEKIIADPLGDDWVTTQDILNNTLNQSNESIERSNEPGFADPRYVDLDAYSRRRDNPGDLIPATRPPGGTLGDLIWRPPNLEYSEQIPAFREQVEQTEQQITGLQEIIWGGDTTDPTARQSELKTNAAIRQLSVIWVCIGKSLESLNKKGCDILAENEEGILTFARDKENAFGKFDTVSVVIDDLRKGKYHFEADEAIPMTWGQQRDLAMWFIDKPPELLQAFGYTDPMNIWNMNSLLGMPTMRVPHLDARDKAMHIISELLNPDPNSPPQLSPDPEDDAAFMAKLVRSYLTKNYELKQANPQGYANVIQYMQACDKAANQPPPKPPIKPTVSLALKGGDVGDPAVQAALQDAGIIPPGTPVAAQPPPPKPGEMGMNGMVNGAPPLPSGPLPLPPMR